jgi:hypothetical protein
MTMQEYARKQLADVRKTLEDIRTNYKGDVRVETTVDMNLTLIDELGSYVDMHHERERA